jgi:hypothetical protein
MKEKTAVAADRPRKPHPLFVALFLTAGEDEDPEDEGRPRRRAGRRQKRVIRNS